MITPASHSIGVGRPIKLEGGKSLVDILSHLRGAPFDIWGGRLEKKVCWKCGQKNKFVVEIDEKYVEQKNHQMVTYIIGKAYDKNIYFSFATKIKKNCRTFITKKSFLAEVKKRLQPTKTLAAPHISNGAFLTPERLNYVTVFSVKAVLPWKLQLRLEIQVQCNA